MTKHHWVLVALSVIAFAAIDAAYAGAKQRHHWARPGVRHAPASAATASSFDPPRMYEARPGVWISTWDCITDEGYGRWRPCSAGGGRVR
jgi:hypothetical protein